MRQMETLVIIASSDQHLGYKGADKDSFLGFLDYVAQQANVSDFVIVGDFVDMWRRDVSGIFLENHDIIEKLLFLKTKMNVHMVVGNHDYHATKLKNHNYPFQFFENLELKKHGKKYRFLHGYQWDDLQEPVFMEALCHVMSDNVGGNLSSIWDMIHGRKGFLARYKLPSGFGRVRTVERLGSLRKRPEIRLKETRQDIEKKAHRAAGRDAILVFGHTHVPFINETNTVVNTGSWVFESSVHNTFVELHPEKISLKAFLNGAVRQVETRDQL